MRSNLAALLALITLPCIAFGSIEDSAWRGRINFLLQQRDRPAALKVYDAHVEETGKQDFNVLQEIALNILEEGSRSSKPEIQLLTLYGAGISANEKALGILEKAMSSRFPQLQLIALHFMSQWKTDRTSEAIKVALRSNFILLRLEGAYLLSQQKSPMASEQIEALMYKVEPEVISVMPKLLAPIGDSESTKLLKKLLNHPDQLVRIEAITSIAEAGRDDLLPQIRILASQTGPAQLEACAAALGKLKDESSAPLLIELAKSPSPFLRLAALQALYQLGRKEVRVEIEKIAEKDVTFAILMLGSMPGSEELLIAKTKSPQLNVRINAALALLELQNANAVPALKEILVKDERDLAFTKSYSYGGGLMAWKAVPCATEICEDQELADAMGLELREEVLDKAMHLPEGEFLKIANGILQKRQNSIIPIVVEKLQTLDSPAAIELLKKYQQTAGAPFIRTSCNLALYEMKEEGPWEAQLEDWVANQQSKQLLEIKTMSFWTTRGERSPHALTPEETTNLLIKCFEAFARRQDDKGVNVLLKAMENGHPDNIYVLAGLLLRATQ